MKKRTLSLFSFSLLLALASSASAQLSQRYPGASLVSGYTSNITDTTSTEVIAANTNNRIYLTQITITNSSSGTASVVKVLNGTTTKYRFNASAGGGASITLVSPLRGEKNTAWNCQPETSGAAVQCSFSGYLYGD